MIKKRAEEFHSLILGLFFVLFDALIRLTMLQLFRLFGLSRNNLRPRHLEIYLASTTSLIIFLIFCGGRWEFVGWFFLFFGAVRLLQIIALNAMSLLFGHRLLPSDVPDRERTRWHFVAILFSLMDVQLIYSFSFYFLNQRYRILNINSESFFDHFYYSLMTLMTVGYGDIVPVKPIGKFLALSEVFMGVFLFVFLVNAAMARFQRHAE